MESFIDPFYLKIGLAVAGVVLLLILWLAWFFFKHVFKYILIFTILLAIALGSAYFRFRAPPPDPNLGKHAYSTESGKYLGVVEGSGSDRQRGEIWIIRPPGRNPVMYSKSRVTIKDAQSHPR